MNFRRITFSAVFFTACIFSFAGTSGTQKNTSDDAVTTAHDAAVAAAKKDSALDSVEYLKKIIPSLSVPSEKRAAYAFLGSVQEQLGLYTDAESSFVSAAAIAAGDAAGMPKKSSEQLVLDAVRCALSAGDSETADSYLNSAVRSSSDETIVAYVKLYEQWSALCRAQKESDIAEPVALLKTYASLPSMSAVCPAVLLTLWHLTGDDSYAQRLKKEFPASPETAIVTGSIQLLPAPFWYFAPRTGSAVPEIQSEPSSPVSSSSGTSDKVVRQQLGLFREKSNAESLVDQLKMKGFAAKITTEKRPSGTTYYIVVVDEDKDGSIGNELRTAGFECYPVFSE